MQYKRLQKHLSKIGYSMKRRAFCMWYLIGALVFFFLHLLLKLHLETMIVLYLSLYFLLPRHMEQFWKSKNQKRRFEEASNYMDMLLYSFGKEGKIPLALEAAADATPQGPMRTVLLKSLDHMRMTFDESEVIKDALSIIEHDYACEKIHNIHLFMLHAEEFGGEINAPLRLLAQDKNHWELRIKEAVQERGKMLRDIILSVAASLFICAAVIYMPVMKIDISSNWLTQILTVVVLLLDAQILFGGQKYMSADWLLLGEQKKDAILEKKMHEWNTFSEKKEWKKSLAGALPFLCIAVWAFLKGSQWGGAVAISIAVFAWNQHRIGHYLASKKLKKEITRAFPVWLMDLVLLLQSENVQMAIQKSYQQVPSVLQEELALLIDRLSMNPESPEPYHQFLDKFAVPEIHSAMNMLYALSAGKGGNAQEQLAELISQSQKMSDIAEREHNHDTSSGMYLLFLAPVLTASVKLVTDMAVFMLSFLSESFF